MNFLFSRTTALLCGLVAVTALSACAPIIIGAAVGGGAMVVTDRRTSGTQVDDEGIELKAANRVGELIGDRGHVSITSYNRLVLITGEVPTAADRSAIEGAISRMEGVKATVNELAVAGNASLTSRSSDSIITSKVKATFLDAKDLQSNTLKVVTERGTVYLMGVVTEREANRAADLTAGISGVMKVVRVFDVISEAEMANISMKAKSSK